MFEAELHRKLPELKAHEDYLTSCVFGALKYLPPHMALLPLLQAAFNYNRCVTLEDYLDSQAIHSSDFHDVQFHFWPRSPVYGEPDLVITLETTSRSYLIPVEVKFFSEKHGEGEKDQLARYYRALVSNEERKTFRQEQIREFSGDLIAFVYVTQFEAEYEIEQTLRILESEGLTEARDQFFHIRWQDFARAVESCMIEEPDGHGRAVYANIRELLAFKNLLPFTGYSEPPESLSAERLLESPVFFRGGEVEASVFSRYSTLPKQLSEGALLCKPVFLRVFQGFPRKPRSLVLHYNRSVYYGGR